MVSSPARWRIRARAKVVLPAPRSPDSVTRSPGLSALATSTMSRWVKPSSGSTTEKLAPAGVVRSIAIACSWSCRRSLARLAEREDAGHGGPAADRGIERHRAAVQLDEGAHEGEAEARAAMARAEGV